MGCHRLALIVPTCGRPADLAACLRSIEQAACPQLVQVVVVDDAPSAPAIVPERIATAAVEVIRNRESIGASASRNRGLLLLRPDVDVVGFLDDDVRLTPYGLTVALAEHGPDRGAITGPIQRYDDGIVSRARQLRYDARYRALRSGQAVEFLAGGNAVIWRDLLRRVGGFSMTAVMSDTLLARELWELGMPCHYVPELVVLHRHSKGARQAVVAACRAGLVERSRPIPSYVRRLGSSAREVPVSPDPSAAALNVALDAVFLAAHATSRASWRWGQLMRRPLIQSPTVDDLARAPEVRESA